MLFTVPLEEYTGIFKFGNLLDSTPASVPVDDFNPYLFTLLNSDCDITAFSEFCES